MKKNVLFALILLITVSIVNTDRCHGKSRNEIKKDTTKQVTFHFRFDKVMLDSGHMSNNASIVELRKVLTDTTITNRIDSVTILATSSPEGVYEHNLMLSKRRASAIKEYLMWKYPSIVRGKIITHTLGENWDGLLERVKADINMPYKTKMIEILSQQVNPGTKKWRLQQVGQGKAWKYIKTNHLRYIRTGVTCIVYYHKVDLPTTPPMEPIAIEPIVEQPAVVEPISEPLAVVSEPLARPTHWGVSMNLLTCFIPNLGVEYYFNERLSVNLRGAYSYLSIKYGSNKAKLWYLSPEVNYHFLSKSSLWGVGHYVSIFGQVSNFNAMWDSKGSQGHFYGGGLGYGYNLQLGQHWLLDFNVGFGLLYLNDDSYRHWANDLKVQDNEFLQYHKRYYFGPTKLGIGLNYRF